MSVMKEEDYLAHYGILRKSGRYPWGSGSTQSKRNKMFLDTISDLRKQGLSDTEICKGFSTDEHPFTTTNLRALTSIAKNEQKQAQIDMALRYRDKGMSNVEIGKRMELNESTVRSLLSPGRKDKAEQLQSIADMLERQVKEKTYLDIGTQVERSLPLGDNPGAPIGVSKERFHTAVAMLQEKGYQVHTVKIPQLGTKDMTTVLTLSKPGTSQKEVWQNRHNIRSIQERSEDGGRTWPGKIGPPLSMSSKKIGIRYAEQGGADSDGVIFVRPGAKNLDLGGASYAQVRIAVDGTHYIKGMAVYKHDLPPGVDVVFNTNKSNTGNKLDALKPMQMVDGKIDLENPFGAAIKAGGQRGHLNILREEGDWDKWSKNLPSQMLSKQSPALAKKQLDLTYENRRKEFNEISALTNPAVKKRLLESFSDGTDSAANHLKAAAMPSQSSKVLMPVPSMKEHEVHAPSYENGTRLALVRFPHGGTFEIPEVTVNNRNREARSLLGSQTKDAIGIHPKVAERLSGADFDGDHVIAIPNIRREVKSTPALERLKGFDPKREFPAYDGMRTIDGGTYNATTRTVHYGPKGPTNLMQHKMGDISNLITDMTIQGANTEELARAVRHSMVIIDSEKHVLDYKTSLKDNGISALKIKYQGKATAGAKTLISRAGAEARPRERRKRRASEGGFIDPATGKKVFVETGATYVDKRGRTQFKTTVSTKLRETEDARTLIDGTGTRIEHLYADHSNRMKALANQSRKEMVNTKAARYEPSANKVYKKQVESLDQKLDLALKNAPLERQAQVLANSVVAQKKQANPGMDADDLKKIKNQALAEMRVRTGAHKQRIDITPDEWEAIQAGAISNNKLNDILKNGDLEQIKKLATPRVQKLMTGTAKARAQAMLSQGFTQAEVAQALGVSLTTLKTGLE